MKFNDFLKLEFKRLFENLPYKMEAEKSFIDGIQSSTFYHIEDFNDGIKSNLFDNDSKIDTHISLFKFDKIKKFKEHITNFNIKVVLLKKTYGMTYSYNLLFLVQKPIIKKVYDQVAEKKVLKNLRDLTGESEILNIVTGKDGILSSVIDDNIILDNLVGDEGMLNRFMGGNESGYEEEVEEEEVEVEEEEVDNIKKYNIDYILGGKKKKKRRKRRKLKKIILKRCETFDNLYNNQSNIITLKIYNIPEVDLVEHLFQIIYIATFKYILPNLYYNYKNIKKIETINLEYNSIVENNKTLDDSFKTIFFFNRNKKLYENAYPKGNVNNVPYQLGDIDVLFSKKPIIYNN